MTAVAVPPHGFRRVLAAGTAGAVLEWYDFAVYGVLAATVLGPLFFPGGDDTAKLLLALATQGIGFVARPVGGVVFGHLGDRIGRRPTLLLTYGLLGAATAGIGLLPTYADVGIAATVALVVLRLVQGFALGGEFGAAVVLVAEHGDARRRGFWAAWPQAGGPLGTVLATAVVAGLALLLGDRAFDDWGWRIAFLLALPLLLAGLWIRRGVEESPLFEPPPRAARSSVVDAIASSPRGVLLGVGARMGENVAFYVYTVFVVAYATQQLGFGRAEVILAVTGAAACQFAGMLLGGAWSDRVGRRTAMLVPSVALLIWAPVFFALVQTGSLPLLWLGTCAGALAHGLLAGPEASWIAELFPTRHRAAGASLVFQGSSIVAGAPAPLLAVWFADDVGTGAVVAYLWLTVALTIAAVLASSETRGRPFGQDPVP